MINSCCAIFEINPEDLSTSTCELDIPNSQCSDCSCYCGYIQYESLAPYMTKLTNNYTQDDDYLNLEVKLRTQILEFSRKFDVETGSEPGQYSTAHYKIIKVYGDGSRYLRIPEFVNGTLELYTLSGQKINPNSYAYINGLIVLNPCVNHDSSSCGCSNSCGTYSGKKSPQGWNGCLQAKAKFGKECFDYPLQQAIRDYIIEYNTYGDVKETNHLGLPISRGFKKPESWITLVAEYKRKKNFYNQFGFA